MRILLTGSSGWLGRALAPRLASLGHQVIGLDPAPSPYATITGSVADAATIRAAFRDHAIEAVIHAGALHKPDIARRPASDFVAVNVQGTLNLLEEAVRHGVTRFVFTFTTSLMISRDIRDATGDSAAWLTEESVPQPRNIYGVTKLAAEHLCRMHHEAHGLPVIVRRTARFFPEPDDMAHAIRQSDANTKANEFLFRRLTLEDAADSHIAALDKAPALGFDSFIISAPPPFTPADCPALMRDAPAIVARHFPDYPALYARLGWTMFDRIDRVYDPTRAARRLGFACRTGFRQVVDSLAAGTWRWEAA